MRTPLGHKQRRVALLAAACQLLALAAAAPAGAVWDAPVDISVVERSTAAGVGLDADGDAIAVWSGGAGVQSVARKAGGAWQPPVTISAPGSRAEAARLAVNARGDAVAVWVADGVLHGAARAEGGAWQAAAAVSAPGEPVQARDVAIDAHGNAVAVWATGSAVKAATLRAGAWQPPVRVSTDQTAKYGSDADPSVAIDPGGDAMVVWVRHGTPDSVHSTVQSSVLPVDGTWQVPESILVGGPHIGVPDVVGDPDGTFIAVWADSGVWHGGPVYAAVRPAGGSWQSPTNLDDSGSQPQVGVDARGTATIVWDLAIQRAPPGPSTVRASERPRGGTWQTPVEISRREGRSVGPQIAVGPQGDAVVVWSHHLVFDPFAKQDPFVVHAAVRRADGSWQAPVRLSAADRMTYGPQPALDARGNALVVWRRLDTSGAVVQSADYVPLAARPPVITALRISPRTFRAARSGPPVMPARRRLGGRVSYTLSRSASVRFTLERVRAGRRVGGRCVKPRTSNRGRPTCTRRVRVRGGFSRTRPTGGDRFTLSGRLRARKLAPGTYVLTATPTADGIVGTNDRARLRIVG